MELNIFKFKLDFKIIDLKLMRQVKIKITEIGKIE